MKFKIVSRLSWIMKVRTGRQTNHSLTVGIIGRDVENLYKSTIQAHEFLHTGLNLLRKLKFSLCFFKKSVKSCCELIHFASSQKVGCAKSTGFSPL